MQRAIAILCALALTGCATAPYGVPGSGGGTGYTPIVDMQGVDYNRYNADLGECRTYAARVDAQQSAVNSALAAGAVIGILSAMLGGNGRTNWTNAAAGAFGGAVGGASRAVVKQEQILINCLAGRGYRSLDAAYVAPAPTIIVQQPVAVAAPALTPVVAPLAVVPTPVGAMSAPVEVAAAPTGETGKDAYTAEQLARRELCNQTPKPSLIHKGAGYESYSVACTNGDALMMRCEFGNCRVLR